MRDLNLYQLIASQRASSVVGYAQSCSAVALCVGGRPDLKTATNTAIVPGPAANKVFELFFFFFAYFCLSFCLYRLETVCQMAKALAGLDIRPHSLVCFLIVKQHTKSSLGLGDDVTTRVGPQHSVILAQRPSLRWTFYTPTVACCCVPTLGIVLCC